LPRASGRKDQTGRKAIALCACPWWLSGSVLFADHRTEIENLVTLIAAAAADKVPEQAIKRLGEYGAIVVTGHIQNGADHRKAAGALSACRPEGQKDAK